MVHRIPRPMYVEVIGTEQIQIRHYPTSQRIQGINRIVITSPSGNEMRGVAVGTWFDSRLREKRLERVHKRQRCEPDPEERERRKREKPRAGYKKTLFSNSPSADVLPLLHHVASRNTAVGLVARTATCTFLLSVDTHANICIAEQKRARDIADYYTREKRLYGPWNAAHAGNPIKWQSGSEQNEKGGEKKMGKKEKRKKTMICIAGPSNFNMGRHARITTYPAQRYSYVLYERRIRGILCAARREYGRVRARARYREHEPPSRPDTPAILSNWSAPSYTDRVTSTRIIMPPDTPLLFPHETRLSFCRASRGTPNCDR